MISPPLSLPFAPHFPPLGGSSDGRAGGSALAMPGCLSLVWEDVFEGHGVVGGGCETQVDDVLGDELEEEA